MLVYFNVGKGYEMTVDLPKDILALRDLLDKLGKYEDADVTFRFPKFENYCIDLPGEMLDKEYTADLYRLNLFVSRLEDLDRIDIAVFKSIVKANPECTVDDMIQMTYGLQTVPVLPCDGYTELGDAAIDLDWVNEIENCSEEIIELLDREKIGKLIYERNGGMFIDGYYCEPGNYEAPQIEITIDKDEPCFFRLLIGPLSSVGDSSNRNTQWISLPCEKGMLDEIANDLGIRTDAIACCEFQSSMPKIYSDPFEEEDTFESLNMLARKMATLSREDIIKLKAMTISEKISDIYDTIKCIDHLTEYEFDCSIHDDSDYGIAYIARNMPTGFDTSILESSDQHDFGSKLLQKHHCTITAYGVISERGGQLFAEPNYEAEQSEEADEDEYMDMGGMSM